MRRRLPRQSEVTVYGKGGTCRRLAVCRGCWGVRVPFRDLEWFHAVRTKYPACRCR